MPREKRPEEVQKVFDHLGRSERLFKKAMERYCKAEQEIGLRPGHKAEMRRRLKALSDEYGNLIKVLEEK